MSELTNPIDPALQAATDHAATRARPQSGASAGAPPPNFDPLAAFLRGPLHLGPASFALVVLVLDIIVDAFIVSQFGAWRTTGDSPPGLLQDWTALAADFLAIPILCGLYLWTVDGHQRVFNMLSRAETFPDAAIVRAQYERSAGWLGKKLVFYAIVAVSLGYTLIQVAGYNEWGPWHTVGGYLQIDPVMSYFRAPFWFLNFYTMLFAVFNVLCTTFALRALFRNQEVRLLPLHPDHCGGLASISQYTIRVAYGLAAVGIVLSVATIYELQEGTLESAVPLLIGIGIYLAVAPALFFMPLATAHDAMQTAKDEELLTLAHAIEDLSEQVKARAIGGGGDTEAEMKRLQTLKQLYQEARGFPVWPYDFASLRRFMTVVTAPLVPAFISIANEVLRENIL